ncbi:MAG: NADH-quinone oxidoreductase subunit C [Sphingomonadales bacterium]|nr:NADH-quinone oxidoreductase subunit C [Sphingomonadales bacterium]
MAHSAPLITKPKGTNAAIKKALGKNLVQLIEANDEIGLLVKRDALVDVMTALRDECEYQQLVEIAGVDWPSRSPRFEVVYCLLSLTKNHRIRVHVETDESDPVPSVTGIWPVAGWLEREVFDMYGVLFSGNNDLRRILTDYGFEGHPQRKDFPLTGYTELRYSEEEKRVKYEPVKLAQDFRSFDFMSPWEGADYILPGDEKAPAAPPPPPPSPTVATPKTTGTPAKTGAGAKANKTAAKTTKGAPKAVKPETAKPRGAKK